MGISGRWFSPKPATSLGHAIQVIGTEEKATMNAKLKMTRGGGNVFLDVGFPPDEANN
jgi:hypothetical protein